MGDDGDGDGDDGRVHSNHIIPYLFEMLHVQFTKRQMQFQSLACHHKHAGSSHCETLMQNFSVQLISDLSQDLPREEI